MLITYYYFSNVYLYLLFCYLVFKEHHYQNREKKSLKTEQETFDQFLCFLNLLRKEVIHPHLPVRIPCYDLTLIISPTFDGFLQ